MLLSWLKKNVVIAWLIVFACCAKASAQTDTVWAEKAKPVPFIKWKHAYDQTLTLKAVLSVAEFDGKYKREDNGKSKVFLTIADALIVIKKIDRLTLGIPKIIYLVGWQYNGHDSKYPAWFEGNEKLKRQQDKNAIESIKWLMQEARQYHTTVSLHINMFDAYKDSPLWEEYVKHDIIAKNADATLRPAEWGYPISYAQEWKTGYAQKRIDSLCKLLPLDEAGTVHIDAFHSWPPMPVIDSNGKAYIDLKKKVISPYLKFTVEDETEAQRNIFKYWASKGIDVTSEGVNFLRETNFAGFQPMAWWYNQKPKDYLRFPASYYTGGVDKSEWGRLFGTSMHGEEEIRNDSANLSGFLEAFCLNTASWYYLNSLDRLYMVTGRDFKKVIFSNKVESRIENGKYYLSQNGKLLVEGEDICIPALWMDTPALIAYSTKGFQNKQWNVPGIFNSYKKLDVYEITSEGKKFLLVIKNKKGLITLTIPAGKGYVIQPHKK